MRGSILGIAEDRSGSLWIATADHVLRINRERLVLGTLDEESLREYGPADGLLGVESVKRHRSVVADGRGRIWHLSDEALTERERDVLQHVAGGNRNRDIAEQLFISEETVKVHVKHIMEKLGASDRRPSHFSAPAHFQSTRASSAAARSSSPANCTGRSRDGRLPRECYAAAPPTVVAKKHGMS